MISSGNSNKPYQEKLESLILEGEALLTHDLDPRSLKDLEKAVNELKVRLFKAKVANEL